MTSELFFFTPFDFNFPRSNYTFVWYFISKSYLSFDLFVLLSAFSSEDELWSFLILLTFEVETLTSDLCYSTWVWWFFSPLWLSLYSHARVPLGDCNILQNFQLILNTISNYEKHTKWTRNLFFCCCCCSNVEMLKLILFFIESWPHSTFSSQRNYTLPRDNTFLTTKRLKITKKSK